MKALTKRISIGLITILFIASLFIGSCTHAPIKYFDNTPIASTTCSADTVYFQNDILPLLNSTCATTGCHNPVSARENVVLTNYNYVMNTGGINLQLPSESKIYRVLVSSGENQMPPSEPWTSQQKAQLLKWISQGAINNSCSGGACDTTNVTFNNNVKPIFETNCYGCHSSTNPSGGIDLTSFSELSVLIDNGALLASIRHDAGYSPMPKGSAKLSDCEIGTIAIWVRDTTLTSGGGGGEGATGTTCDPDTVYFQNTVLPLISTSCAVSGCHDATTRKHGIQLTDYSSIIQTGGVSAGNPNSSKLYTVLSGGGDKQGSTANNTLDDIMPPSPRSPFTTGQKDIVKNWILQGAKNNSCSAACDTTSVTFSGSVFPIIQTYCLGCHNSPSPGGGIYLRNYNDLVAVVNNGKLWGSINHDAGYSPMPKNGNKLSDCELSTFKIWITDGTPNN